MEVRRHKRRDPHAHFVTSPGYPARVSRARRAWRGAVPAVALTALLDVLLVSNAFALAIAGTPSGCLCVIEEIDSPHAYEGTDVLDAPLITIDADGSVEVAGQRVLAPPSTAAVSEPIPELTQMLRARRAYAGELHPELPPQLGVALDVDKETPAHLVKRVAAAATEAGYENLSFLVKRRLDPPYAGSDAPPRLRDKLRAGIARRVW